MISTFIESQPLELDKFKICYSIQIVGHTHWYLKFFNISSSGESTTAVHCVVFAETEAGFDLVFSTGHTDDFVSLHPVENPLHQFTVCVWLRTQDVLHYGTLFSYAAHSNWLATDDVDVFTLHNYGKLKVCF